MQDFSLGMACFFQNRPMIGNGKQMKGETDMNHLQFSLNAAIPIFLVMVTGYLLRRTHVVDESMLPLSSYCVS